MTEQSRASMCKLLVKHVCRQPLAPRCSGRETISLISCKVLLHFFSPLGFKFCCMVLRVANARALVIDLRRLCYLQPVQWITTRADSDNCAVIRVSTTISCTLPFYFFLECYRWVMDFKATAWRRVLIAQFGEYFDDALCS